MVLGVGDKLIFIDSVPRDRIPNWATVSLMDPIIVSRLAGQVLTTIGWSGRYIYNPITSAPVLVLSEMEE